MITPKNANNAYTVSIKRQTQTFPSYLIAVSGWVNVDSKLKKVSGCRLPVSSI